MFEIPDEPNRSLDAGYWNALLADALVVIRASNPTHTVIVGPASYNSLKALPCICLLLDIMILSFVPPRRLRLALRGMPWIHSVIRPSQKFRSVAVPV
ncbi:hypothetical protein [Sodalis sp. RH22]|uniref:hypothetical protein n=1 Tax=unclassified Sodalis (in: enterobacteria) TaxID=2636512 RepID=UPI0039B4C515